MAASKFQWSELSQTYRSAIVGGGIFFGVIMVSQLLKGEPAPDPTKKTPDQQTNIVTVNRQNITVEDLAGKIESLSTRMGRNDKATKDIEEIKQMLFETQQKLNSSSDSPWKAEEMVSQIDFLKKQIDDLRRNGVTQKSEARTSTQTATIPAKTDAEKVNLAEPIPPVAEVPVRPLMRWIGEEEAPKKAEATNTAEEDGLLDQLLAGGMFDGVLLTGMDAPTNSVAKSSPTPALIRVKSEAILPNFYQADIKECFVIASAYGVLSTERAVMRTEKLTCVGENGKAIEKKIDGFVVGEDGKAGLRGRLVSKQGQFIAKALTAGFLEGVSKALQPYQTPTLNLSPGQTQQYQTADMNMVGQKGVYGGIASAATSVSKIYLDMAKEMFPVIEVDANRRVTIVMLNGTNISEEDKKD
jgi:conjugal transfer pilus assembly protein TraB